MDDETDIPPAPRTPLKVGELSRSDHHRFAADIEKLLKDAEGLRLRYMKKHQARANTALTLGLVFALVGGGLFGWFLLMEADIMRALASIALALIVPLFFNLRSNEPIKNYRAEYKTKFLPQMARALGGFEFHPTRGISSKIIAKTGIVPPHDLYESEDCFMGQYNGVKVIFSEARLLNNKGRAAPVFEGIFVLLEAPEDCIEGHTILSADSISFNKWRSTRWAKLQDVAVEAENPEWNRFQIVSDKPEAARAMITQNFLKELSEAADIFDRAHISAALFRKRFIFLIIPYARDMFEPSSVHIPVATRQHALQCKREIEQILEIIDVFVLFQKSSA